MARFLDTCSLSQKDVQKEEIKREAQSETILEGSPCLEKTCSAKSLAKSWAEAVVWVFIKRLTLENLSTTTRIESYPFEGGIWEIKSMQSESQGLGAMGRGVHRPYFLC